MRLDDDKKKRLAELEAAIRQQLENGSKYLLADTLIEVHDLIAPAGTTKQQEVRIWGDWAKRNRFNGLAKTTAYRLMAAVRVSRQRFHPGLISNLVKSGHMAGITPTEKQPLGKFTAILEQLASSDNDELNAKFSALLTPPKKEDGTDGEWPQISDEVMADLALMLTTTKKAKPESPKQISRNSSSTCLRASATKPTPSFVSRKKSAVPGTGSRR